MKNQRYEVQKLFSWTKHPEQFSSASKHKNDRNVINLWLN